MTERKVITIMKILATVLIAAQGVYYSIVEPSYMDSYNAIMAAFVIFVVWRF
jgi:hypothetical protein